jgi:hypothetical protein
VRRSIRDHHAAVATLLVGAGLLLVPWLFYMSVALPSTTRAHNWSVMWTGIDAAEAVGLIVTGLFTWRRSRYRSIPAAVTAAVLILDAWVDVITSAAGHATEMAIVMAVAVEIPVATVCLALAVTSLRGSAVDVPSQVQPVAARLEEREKPVSNAADFHRIGTDC